MRTREIIDGLRDTYIDSVIYAHASDINKLAESFDVDSNYLSSLVRLHIPLYSKDEIVQQHGLIVIQKILYSLRKELSELNYYCNIHKSLNGIAILGEKARIKRCNKSMWIEDSTHARPNIIFCEVSESLGNEIQNKLHYIHNARKDTIFHLGLCIEGFAAPLCYAAFSILDRKYLKDALNFCLPETCSKPNKVAVMTRAFGYNPLPSNMMSTLFSCCSEKLKKEGFDYIITAINPFLGFKGSIFLGSSYFAFATSPMKYFYNSSGLYLNRRTSLTDIICQNYSTPPIVWLVHPLSAKDMRYFELGELDVIYHISKKEYING